MPLVAGPYAKNFGQPDQTIEMPLLSANIVDVGDFTVGHIVHTPGWRWSTPGQPTVGGEWCQARHVGFALSGRAAVLLQDGTELEFGPNYVVDIPPGHDAWVLGDEPLVQLEWTGFYTFI